MRIKTSILLILLLQVSNTFSQELSQTLVWKVSGGDLAGKSYIVGTVPVKDSTFYQYPQKTFSVLHKTAAFVAFDNKDVTNTAKQVRNQEFKNFSKNYPIYPSQYFETLATQNVKPIIELGNDLSYQHLYAKTDTKAQTKFALQDAFLSGDIAGVVQERLQMDLNNAILTSIQNEKNYSLVEKLIQQMRAQSVFFPVDVAYLDGQNGLINLLQARGYAVAPMFEKDFARKAKEVETQRLLAQQIHNQGLNNGAPVTTSTTQAPQLTTSGLDGLTRTKYEKLKLPMGVINLKNWAEYNLFDGVITYLSPNKLKKSSDYEEVYSTMNNNLEYSIQLAPRFDNRKQLVEKLVINNGGQLTSASKAVFQGYPATEVELIYSENTLSKHLVVDYPTQTIIASVKGQTPQIFSIEQQHFFDHLQLKQVEIPQEVSTETEGLEPQEKPWVAYKLNEMNMYLPIQPQDVSSELKNGKKLSSYVIPRGEVDDNLYLFSSVEKEPQPLFKLFNESINKATEHSRAVIVDRNVLPTDRPDYSYYLLKDAVGNFYRVEYYYTNNRFYQVIVKGSKKNIEGENARKVLNSIYFAQSLK